MIEFKGKLTLQLRDKSSELNESEMYVVPQSIEHCLIATHDTHFMMVESANIGYLENQSAVTITDQQYI